MGVELAVMGGLAAAGAASSAYSASQQAKAAKKGSTSTTAPWAPQQQYLKKAFQDAEDNYYDQKGSPYYQGPTYAGLNGTQMGAINQTKGYTGGLGNQLANGASQVALGSMGNATMAGNNAAGFASNGGGYMNGALAGGLQSNAMSGMGQMGDAIGATDGALRLAQGDTTGQNIAAAGQYANNPYLQSQIDAAGNDAVTALGRNLVGLNNSASAGGNLNSSRAGAAEAVMTQGTADQIARTSADMRSAAYQNGLGLAEQARGTNMQGALSAGSQYGNLVQTGQSAAGQLEDSRQFGVQARMNGNQQLLQSGQLGLDAAQVGNGLSMGNINANMAAGGVLQANQQGLYDQAFQKWQGNDTRANDILSQYMGLVGGTQYGSTTKTSTPYAGQGAALSGVQGALGGFTGALGAYGAYKNVMGGGGFGSSAPQFGGYTNAAQVGPISWS